jgi:hypothetical protein
MLPSSPPPTPGTAAALAASARRPSRKGLWLALAAVQVAGGLFALGWWWHLTGQRQAAFQAAAAQLARQPHPVLGRLRQVEAPSVATMDSRTVARFEFVARYDVGTATVSLTARQQDGRWQLQRTAWASAALDHAGAARLPPK